LAFVNCINHGDLPGLVSLMSDDHRLQVFDETPVTGRDDNERAWSGYFEAFPSYLIIRITLLRLPTGRSLSSATPPDRISASRTTRNHCSP